MNVNLWGGSFLNYLFNDIITHIPIHALRKGFLRLFNKKISKSSVILLHTKILNFWKIEIGDRVIINQYCLLDCRCYTISIMHDTDIGPYTRIWTAGHDPDSESHAVTGGNVLIGNHVWIASGVTILPSVKIERGAVIASGSIVTKSVGELSIVAGNPAREIRKRNNVCGYRIGFTPIFN